MSEILDLLPIPAERDFPAGRFEARRETLVASIRADRVNERFALAVLRAARRGLVKTWLWLLGIVALAVALLMLGTSAQQRPAERGAVAFLAVAGTAQVAIALAPRVGHAA